MANKKIEEDAKKLSEKFNQLSELKKREDRIRANAVQVPVAPITKTDHYKRDPNERKSKSPEPKDRLLGPAQNSPGIVKNSPRKVPLIKSLVGNQSPKELAKSMT
jgi:hypothetical protein